jgi:hypothetical protein
MAHVHIPKPLHGWRAFVGEVGIIVLGVLIALAAEQFVDGLQWRTKVKRAETAMRLELAEDDAPQAYARLLIAGCLDEEIARIHDRAGHVPIKDLRAWVAAYAPPVRSWDSEAWKAVLGSDVGNHMGAERLVAWSKPYRLVPALNDYNSHEREIAVDLHDALSPNDDQSPADLNALRRDAGQLRDLNRVFYRVSQLMLSRAHVVGAIIPEQSRHDLVGEARAMYGNCVRVPNLSKVPLAQGLSADLRPAPLPFTD